MKRLFALAIVCLLAAGCGGNSYQDALAVHRLEKEALDDLIEDRDRLQLQMEREIAEIKKTDEEYRAEVNSVGWNPSLEKTWKQYEAQSISSIKAIVDTTQPRIDELNAQIEAQEKIVRDSQAEVDRYRGS